MDKFEHVKKATQTRNHTCHWPGCKKQVPPAMWGCKIHWYKLPLKLRTQIWRTYKTGQEISGDVSPEYFETAHLVEQWINKNYPTQTEMSVE